MTSSHSLPIHRLVAAFAFVGVGSLLGGCPIYDDSTYYDDGPRPYSPTQSCNTAYDCPNGYTCSGGYCSANSASSCSSPNGCAPGSVCGTDNRCHAGSCQTYGCASGYTCTLSGGSVQCIATTSASDGGKTEAGPPPECSSDSTCVTKVGAGAKCLSGSCVASADQCTDATQCSGTAQCVNGVCTPSCDATHPCPTGYACDAAKGVCTGNASPCTSSTQCSGENVCVGGHCVAPCNGESCSGDLVCVGGGCVPNQKPQFVCQTEGVRDACASGSLCLHHSCYIACTGGADAGDAGGSCQSADKFNQCKAVTTSTGTYSVCGSSSNLGTECDPTLNKACNGGKVCIDGFCR